MDLFYRIYMKIRKSINLDLSFITTSSKLLSFNVGSDEAFSLTLLIKLFVMLDNRPFLLVDSNI